MMLTANLPTSIIQFKIISNDTWTYFEIHRELVSLNEFYDNAVWKSSNVWNVFFKPEIN